MAPQGVEPTSQITGPVVHAPLLQISPVPQAFPQDPQLRSSVWSLAQMAPQGVVPTSQKIGVLVQALLLQVSPVSQAFPQVPQFASSVWRLAQMKFLGEVFEVGEKESRLHAVRPVLQTQVPPWQVEPVGQA